MSDEPLTSTLGLFTEELPVVFLVTQIENSEWGWKIRLLLSALGYDYKITDS